MCGCRENIPVRVCGETLNPKKSQQMIKAINGRLARISEYFNEEVE